MNLCNEAISPDFFECIEIEWEPGSRILRIYVDSLNGETVDIDSCLRVNRRLADLSSLDSFMNGNYQLEVSSPGIERPLRRLEHFRKFIGSRISVRLTEKVQGRKEGVGELISVDGEQVSMTLENSTEWNFPHSFIQKARILHDW